MKLAIRHVTSYAYDPAASAVAMRLKLYPGQFEGQRVESWTVSVNEAEMTSDFTDGWGDRIRTLFLRGEIDRAEIVAQGEVETEDKAGMLRGLRAALKPGVCLRATPRTRADAALRDLAAESAAGGGSALDQTHRLRELVAERVVYTPGATGPATTAAAALAQGKGVCQDQAQVMIACARALDRPARYVAGYHLPSPDGSDDATTHAWAEVWIEEFGWIGFDPANALCPTDAYVRLCSGLDAAEAAPIRGYAEGPTEETLRSSVSIRPI